MTDYYMDQTRLVVAKREDEKYPLIIAAMPQSTWEIIPVEEWDEWKRERARAFLDDDWTAYDYIEVVITIPTSRLAAMFNAREIVPDFWEKG